MKILVLAPLQQENLQKIEQSFPNINFIFSSNQTVTQEMIDDCDVIVGNPSFQFDLNKENLQAILLNSAGSDEYVKKGILHPHTILTNASGTYGKAIAEHTIGMILMLNKNLKTYAYHMQNHLWRPLLTGKELYKSTVVIVGLGDLGYELAKRLKAFDCKIIGIKRTLSPLPKDIDELYTTKDLNQVLPRADFIIIALPQTKETIHLFNKERFSLMKKDAVFINIGRGSAVNTQDLQEALESGHFFGVGLDVVEEEPLPENSALWDFDNTIITPHASGGYVWNSARQYYTDLVIRNIHHILNHEQLENEVDFQTGYRKTV